MSRRKSKLRQYLGLELMAALVIVFASVAAMAHLDSPAPENATVEVDGEELARLRQQVSQLQLRQDELVACMADNGLDEDAARILQQEVEELRARHTKPPIITLGEAEGYKFSGGSSKVGHPFKRVLNGDVIDKVLAAKASHQVNKIIVTGHTDEVAMGTSAKKSSHDAGLVGYIHGTTSHVRSTSNVELAMERAGSVARILKANSRLREAGITIAVRSAGQTERADGRLTDGRNRKSDESRRRIEIRLVRD